MFTAHNERPQWRVVYDHLAALTIGDVVTDQELRGLLPGVPAASVSTAYRRALVHLENEDHRSMDRVRCVGYRMVAASEHERLARTQHKRAKRRLTTAVRKAHSADRSLLTPDQRRRIDAVEEHLGNLASMTARLSVRVDQHDRDLAKLRREGEADVAHLGARLDELAELLDRHGIKSPDKSAPEGVAS